MKKESLFIIGMFSMTIAIILGMFPGDLPLIDFFKGVFTGISLVTNIGFLIRFRLDKNQNNDILSKNKFEENSQNGYN
jgi:hypothetical protein